MASNETFAGRTALVTGAASGIGKSCAQWLDSNGIAELILIDLNAGALGELELSCKVSAVAGDVGDPELWQKISRDHPSYHYSIANAGIGAGGPIKELPFEEWRRVMRVNLDGAFLTLSNAMNAIEKSGGGSAVIVSSATATKALPGLGAYGASKAAVAHMARIAALEGAPHNIRINAIAPGGVDTAIWESSEDFQKMAAEQGREAAIAALAIGTPRGELATSEEIAATIGFLLSDSARNITGTLIASDGGFTL